MIEMCKEMKRLRELLDQHNIAWEDYSTIQSEEVIEKLMKNSSIKKREFYDTTIYRTFFAFNNKTWSVINGFGTYGGVSPHEKINYGLLEVWDGEHDTEGWLTANEVLELTGIVNETDKQG